VIDTLTIARVVDKFFKTLAKLPSSSVFSLDKSKRLAQKYKKGKGLSEREKKP
jgi:hypothetical protein